MKNSQSTTDCWKGDRFKPRDRRGGQRKLVHALEFQADTDQKRATDFSENVVDVYSLLTVYAPFLNVPSLKPKTIHLFSTLPHIHKNDRSTSHPQPNTAVTNNNFTHFSFFIVKRRGVFFFCCAFIMDGVDFILHVFYR